MSNKKDISLKMLFGLMALAAILRLFIATQQMPFLMPGSRPIDDDLYFKMANSIASGNWLGEYNYLTLSKYPFFAIYLAILNKLKIPYLFANASALIAVSAVTVWAIAPAVKRNWCRLAVFCLLIFNPSAMDRYNLRVYRDAIYPLFCLLFFAGMAGFALRLKDKISHSILFLAFAGVGLGLGYITREDGYWLIPFGAVACIICGVYICLDKTLDKKPARLMSMVLPYVITLMCVFTICSINNKYYGKFILTDFNSGPFADAYANMTRLPHQNWHPVVDVPEDVRQLMYENCPTFAPFEEHLEEGSAIRGGFFRVEIGDYYSGSFYWMLRFAADYMGQYENLADTDAYWAQIRDEVSALCDVTAGSLPRRHGITPPIKAEYVQPVIAEALASLKFVLTYQNVSGYNTTLSDDTSGQIAKWNAFLHDVSNYSAIEYTADPYYTPLQLKTFKLIDALVSIYRIILPLMLLGALAGCVYGFTKFTKLCEKSQLMTFVTLGLLLMAVFRIFIIAFMEVAAFAIGTQAMYLGCVYPIFLLAGATGLAVFEK